MSACTVVAKGGVGESGNSVQLTHHVAGTVSKLMKLTTTGSSLCPNTGVIASIVVNGSVFVTGVMTSTNSSIQIEAPGGADVVAVAHTVPLFNKIHCVRLGELDLALEECDLVTVRDSDQSDKRSVVNCDGVSTRNWAAWLNQMPPKPDDFHVTGEVLVSNPGVDIFLTERIPQGTNDNILQLEITLVQNPGIWPQMMIWKQARFDRIPATKKYDSVEIFCDGNIIGNAKVDVVV